MRKSGHSDRTKVTSEPCRASQACHLKGMVGEGCHFLPAIKSWASFLFSHSLVPALSPAPLPSQVFPLFTTSGSLPVTWRMNGRLMP